MKRAVIYLRVSTAQQADKDYDPEGFSIPAQREGCQRKASELGAMVEEEFIDRGESAKSANRTALRRMIDYVKEQRPDYVVVHKVDRLARNRYDDAGIYLELKAAGAQLVSASEAIDDTPSGRLLHGIMATLAEYYSQNLATEIIKGTTKKAQAGGTPGMTKVGYLHVRELVDGREIRTIAVDPERAPLVQWAFKAYATGNWTVRQLTEELGRRGLTARPTPKRPAQPLTRSYVASLLSSRYYLGKVTYRGVEYQGRHEPLVSAELFEQVQLVLKTHDKAGVRQRKHHHYLKGTVFCRRCGSRMSLQNVNGNGGRYLYFYCLGRHRGMTCNQPYVQADQLEERVAEFWSVIQLEPDRVERIREWVNDDFAKRERRAGRDSKRYEDRATQLREELRRSIQAYSSGVVTRLDILKEEQDRLTAELEQTEMLLARATQQLSRTRRFLNQVLDLVPDCQAAYRKGGPTVRRHYNQVFWTKLWIDEGRIVSGELAEPIATMLAEDLVKRFQREAQNPDLVLLGQGSSKANLVETTGLEPATLLARGGWSTAVASRRSRSHAPRRLHRRDMVPEPA